MSGRAQARGDGAEVLSDANGNATGGGGGIIFAFVGNV
jgi:hypothetical protein